ncbi:WW domain-binding protein 11-like [Drosophila simulans]|uniref:WW domain-binding protein 11-like n=1 Tax=Drosophila simulans TaxID=7240 RepID=UPI001D11B476|nr:WW domain-binding protein 11-like [Drosophila simulans]
MAAHVFHVREVRENGAGEQPGGIWSRDSGSYLQLLASPLVSRSPSPGSVEDPEEIPDIELEDDQPMAETEGVAEVITLSSESEEDDDGGETVTPEVSSDEDETARMAYRSVRRATQGQGRISLGVAQPTEDPVDMRRFMEARVATLRRFQQMVDARQVADAEAAWQERLARLQEEEEALWAPATKQPEPTQPLARQLPPTPQPPLPLTPPPTRPPPLPPPPPTQSPPPTPPRMTATQSPPPTPPRMTPAQAPLPTPPRPTPPRPTRTPSTPPPQPRTPTPPPQQGECPRYDRQQAWEIPQAHVGQVVRTIEMGGRLWHQQEEEEGRGGSDRLENAGPGVTRSAITRPSRG